MIDDTPSMPGNDSDQPLFDRALIIGMGLIGGSIGHGLVCNRVCRRVMGYDINLGHSQLALRRGLIDEIASVLENAINSADLIVLAVPVGRTGSLLKVVAKYASMRAVVVDTGSVKQSFSKQCADLLPAHLRRRVVPSHPIAGHTSSGPDCADKRLMENCALIMTPISGVDSDVLASVERMWRRIGLTIVSMSAQDHDAIYANLSHLPHFMAFSLMLHIQQTGMEQRRIKALAGNAFADMTRHANVDVDMWCDIFRHNRHEISRSLSEFRSCLDVLEHAMMDNDAALQALLTKVRAQA